MGSLRNPALFLVALIGGFAAFGAATAQTVEIDHARLAREALEKHIEPGYRRLVEAFGKMEASARETCAAPDKGKLQALRDSFVGAVKAWGAIAQINFGPIRTDNRFERIWFWPDRKSIGQRQVGKALRQKPEDYTDPAALAGKSIAVQGLGALEQILYGDKVDLIAAGQGGFACKYAKAIASNLKAIAGETEAAWREDGAFGRLWLNPGPENRTYLHDRETTFALVKALIEALERVRDVELARPLGLTQNRRVLPGPFSDSGLTMTFIAARISGLRSLLVKSGLAAEMARVAEANHDAQSQGDVKQTLFEMELSEGRSAELAKIANILSSSARRSEAVALGYPLKSARFAFSNAAGRLTKLPVGYNASDGD
jgi:predicted lipoprotein